MLAATQTQSKEAHSKKITQEAKNNSEAVCI